MIRKIIGTLLLSAITSNHIFCITKTKARVSSAAVGTTVGLTTAAGVIGLSYAAKNYGNAFCQNNGKLIGLSGVASGAAMGMATYFLMMRVLHGYMPEYIFDEIEQVLDLLDKDEFAKKQFKSDEELIQYINSKFGASFSSQGSINYLKELDSKLENVVVWLKNTYDEVIKTNLEQSYNVLEEHAALLKQFINSKQVLVLLAFIKTDSLVNKEINSADDLVILNKRNIFSDNLINEALSKLSIHLGSLKTAQSILTDLLIKIPSKPKFNDIFQQLKDLSVQVDELTCLIRLKKCQINIFVLRNSVNSERERDKLEDLLAISNSYDAEIQDISTQVAKIKEPTLFCHPELDSGSMDCSSLQNLCLAVTDNVNVVRNQIYLKIADIIINTAESNSLVSQRFGSIEDFVYYAAAEFEKSWYLVLAKQKLVTCLNDLDYAKRIVEYVQSTTSTRSTYKDEQLQTLSEKLDLLIKNVKDKIFVVVKNAAYDMQLQMQEQFLNDQEKKELKDRLAYEVHEHEQALTKLRQLYEKDLKDVKIKYEQMLDDLKKKLKHESDSELSKVKNEYEDKLKRLRQQLSSINVGKPHNKYIGECCAICLDDFAHGDSVGILKCNHFFHKKCIEESLHKAGQKCPLCRAYTTKVDRTDTV